MNEETKAIVFLPLSQGKVAVIDFDDFEKVRPYKWHLSKSQNNLYARHNFSNDAGYLILHRFLLDAPDNMDVDPRDGDGLNNRRNNIRLCTPSQNAQARQRKRPSMTSSFRGVFWDKHKAHKAAWTARLRFNGKNIHCGSFKKEEDAARAYDKKAIELFGEWASPNFPIKEAACAS